MSVLRAAAAVVVVAGLACAGVAGGQPTPATQAAQSYIVLFRAGVDVASTTRALERQGRFVSRFRYEHAVRGFAASLTSRQRAALVRDSRVSTVTPDYTVSASMVEPALPGETLPTGARRIGAILTSSRRGGADVRQPSTVGVAVLDTGVDLDHPDLNAVSGTDCVFPGTSADDDAGHGTHVAGIIAARNNGGGVVGVVPGTTIYAVKVLFASQPTPISYVICGVDWVTQNAATLGIRVVNMSLGGDGASGASCASDPLRLAICNSTAAGVTYVVAAGNSATDLTTSVPASFPEVLTVTSISDGDGTPGGIAGPVSCPNSLTPNGDDTASNFSNYATTPTAAAHVVAAPGKCILSTWNGGGYAEISGTSMAAPHVAGVVALCLGTGGRAGPCTGMTPAQIVTKIVSDAAAGPAGYGFTATPGRLYGNLARAGVYR
jgi:subtilisin family serine protease